MNYLQIVNSVLRRLREDEVTAVNNNDYSTLVGDFVNEAKREVEDSWDWGQLRGTVQIVTSSGTRRYALSGLSYTYKVLEVYNDTDNAYMTKAAYREMNELMTGDSANDTGAPTHWAINGANANVPYTDMWPIPDGVYNINMNVVAPQNDLELDVDVIQVPPAPVILLAVAKAISERGDDAGMQYGEVLQDGRKALSDAIAKDAHMYEEELIWGAV